jgi:serine/threonine-protein kinase
LLYQGKWCDLYTAQPADAQGSPRSDYVVKIIHQTVQADPEAARQIRSEAAAAASARHPHLISVLDAQLNGTRPFIVMPRIEGTTLSGFLQTASLPLPVALWVARQTAQALETLHRSGWIHGDVKPDNLLMDSRGHVTLIDLGFAQRVGATRSHLLMGTPDFAAPEWLQESAIAEPSTDIFSLGRTLQTLLAGQESLPKNVQALLQKMTAEEPAARIAADRLGDMLLKLEIENLHHHIQPSSALCRKSA